MNEYRILQIGYEQMRSRADGAEAKRDQLREALNNLMRYAGHELNCNCAPLCACGYLVARDAARDALYKPVTGHASSLEENAQ